MRQAIWSLSVLCIDGFRVAYKAMDTKGGSMEMQEPVEFAEWPKLLLAGDGCKCPVCGRTWQLHGRGQGFVKAGAFRHVSACFVAELAKRGLQMGKWDDDRQAHRLVPL